jgi:hypothetical protein
MKVIRNNLLAGAILAVALFAGEKVGAQPGVVHSNQLPTAFQALVPQGATLDAPQTTKMPGSGTGTVTFAARRTGKDGRFETGYLFELTIVTARAIETVEKWRTMYKQDLESKVGSKMKEANSSEICDDELPELTEYTWGAGITWRTVCKNTDGDNIRNEIYYDGIYYGFIGEDGGIFKLFTLTVKYGENPEEADEWAKKAAQLISETSLDQL